MSVLQRFKAGLKQAIEKKYEPKFAVGDTIFCSKYKTARVITDIVSMDWDKTGNMTVYKLKDFRTGRYDIIREAYKIDFGYEKANERALTILYGEK